MRLQTYHTIHLTSIAKAYTLARRLTFDKTTLFLFWDEWLMLSHLADVALNPSQSSPVLTILVPVWFIITSLMFCCITKLFL